MQVLRPSCPQIYPVAGAIISNFQTGLNGCLSNATILTHASKAFPLDQGSENALDFAGPMVSVLTQL